jgi:hypothetical protein
VPAQVFGQCEGGFHRGIRTRDEELAAPARDDVASSHAERKREATATSTLSPIACPCPSFTS